MWGYPHGQAENRISKPYVIPQSPAESRRFDVSLAHHWRTRRLSGVQLEPGRKGPLDRG